MANHALQRLLRIMGTFDLATGHADTFDDALDSLESELRDVLGHYRAALASALTEKQEPFGYFRPEPFGWTDCAETDEGAIALYEHPAPVNKQLLEALKTCVCAMQDYQAGIGITEMFDAGERMGRAAIAAAEKEMK